MTRQRLRLPALLVVGLGVLVAGVQLAGAAGDDTVAVVLVSGRDDHGLLQKATLPLVTEPAGDVVSALVADGTFAEVLEVRGTWLRIRSVADPSAAGWIDDFYLRSRAVLHNARQVTFVAAEGSSPVRVQVRLVDDAASPFWVEANHLTEVGADVEPHEH